MKVLPKFSTGDSETAWSYSDISAWISDDLSVQLLDISSYRRL